MPTLARLLGLAVVAAPIALHGQSTGNASPVGAYTPVPQLPGMGRPVDTAAVAARRRALLRRIGRGTVLIPAAHERDIEAEVLQDNDFRQDNTFFYLTRSEERRVGKECRSRGSAYH